MLCPLKYNNSIILDGLSDKDKSKGYNCEKEKCAWWTNTRTGFYNHSEGKQDVRVENNCAIKLIAEK